ncbi:MAG TPA: hypothetical protein VK932_12825 [Kofleriaceae bacterium]|nr:hypothetical protein [Kofleriaceae bacterium]
MSWLRRIAPAAVLVAAASAAGCSSVSTVRVQPDNLYVGPGMKPIAVIHAQVTSAYLLFIPIPGHVDLDRVVNRMLLATAKTLGADKVVNVRVDITPDGGIWTLRKLFLWRTAEASGVAVVIEDPAAAPAANPAVKEP